MSRCQFMVDKIRKKEKEKLLKSSSCQKIFFNILFYLIFVRLGGQGENQYDRERERELNRLRNMERNSNIFND